MPQGKVKWFNNAKGYGFIIEDGGSEDLFAHFSSIQMEGYKTLKAGQTVQFEKQPSGKGVHAVNIVPTDLPQNTASESTTGSSVDTLKSAQNDAHMGSSISDDQKGDQKEASVEDAATGNSSSDKAENIAPKAAAAI